MPSIKKNVKTNSENLSSTDVARLAGVSQATVSRVLSGGANVSAKTREKVMQVVRELGYQPNPFAQAMRTGRSSTFGVAVSRITNPIVPEILEALGAAIAACGRRMVVWNTDTEGEEGVVNAASLGAVDGVIFTAASHQSKAIDGVLKSGAPVVSFNRYLEGAQCDQIVSTNFEGAETLAAYLSNNGRSRIAFVNGPTNRTTLHDRESGFRAGLAEAGRALTPTLYFQSEFRMDAFRQAAIDWMQGPTPPDAIACGNDVIALGVLNGLQAAGMRVPEDVWVTGFDGIAMSAWDIVGLTTMHQPLETMAADAVETLEKRCQGGAAAPKLIQYRTEFIARKSTNNTPLRQ